jgi:hypothetical protein
MKVSTMDMVSELKSFCFLAGPSGFEVISLQKVDSLVVSGMYREAKKVSKKYNLPQIVYMSNLNYL